MGWPSRPQRPPWQPPDWQTPWLLEHIEPEPTQTLVLLSQHPPLAQAPPWQHGWPGPPQAVHWLLLLAHARPDAVQ